METIDFVLKELLDSYGYSTEMLADEMGVSISAITRWAKGDTKPRPLVEGKLRELYRQNTLLLNERRSKYTLANNSNEVYIRESIDTTLMELRESLHRHGRLSSRNEALDELSKLLFAHVMTDGGISRITVLGAETKEVDAAVALVDFVKLAFETNLPTSLGHEMSIADFELKLKPQENVLAIEIITAFEKLHQKLLTKGIDSFQGMDILNDVFGKFLADSFANEKQLGQYLTPTEVVKFMVHLAIETMSEEEIEKLCSPQCCEKFGFILDPSCGVGSFLTEILRALYTEVETRQTSESLPKWIECMVSKVLVGIDKSERMIRLALTSMATFGLPAAQLHLANSLAKKGADTEVTKSLDGKVQLILTNPPFGAEFCGDDLFSYRIGNTEVGKTSSKINSEVLFIERYLDWLAPGGQFLAIVPDSILTNRGIYETLRHKLADSIQIVSIISLPSVTFGAAGTNTKTSILHVRKRLSSEIANHKTFFAICNDIGYSVRTRNTQRTKTNNGKGKGDLPKILQAFISSDSTPENVRFSANVEHSIRWDANYHVSLSTDIADKINNPSNHTIFVSNVATLANDRTDPRRWGTKTFNYIEISDIDSETCTVRTQSVACSDAPSRARKLVKTGDVLFSTVRPERRTVGVVQAEQNGAVCSTGLAVLRPLTISPLVLAYLLKTDIVINQILRNTLGIAYPAIDEQCLLTIMLPINQKDIDSLREKSNSLLNLEKQTNQARRDLNNAIYQTIQMWEGQEKNELLLL